MPLSAVVGVLLFTACSACAFGAEAVCARVDSVRGDGLGLTTSVLVCVGGEAGGASAGFGTGVTSAVTGKMVASTVSGGVGSGVLMSLAVNHSVASRRPCRTPLKSMFFLLRCMWIDLGIGEWR